MLVSAANCIVDELKYDGFSEIYQLRDYHIDGILSVIDGAGVTIDTASYTKFTKVGPKEKAFVVNLTKPPININKIDAFVWSPFVDTFANYTTCRTANGDMHPYAHTLIFETFKSTGRLPKDMVYLLWNRFFDVTKNIPKKACVLYPTCFLSPTLRMTDRVIEMNSVAKKKAIQYGWKIFEVAHPVSCDGSWLHYTLESRKDMLNSLTSYLVSK